MQKAFVALLLRKMLYMHGVQRQFSFDIVTSSLQTYNLPLRHSLSYYKPWDR